MPNAKPVEFHLVAYCRRWALNQMMPSLASADQPLGAELIHLTDVTK